jgi:PAS domain S-box-containing protein
MTARTGEGDEEGRMESGTRSVNDPGPDPGEGRYRAIVEVASEGIWIVDSGGLTTYVNPALERMLGYTASEMLGRSLFEFLPEDELSAAEGRFLLRLEGERAKAEVRFLRKDGSLLHALVSSAHLNTGDGSVQEVVGMITDISDRKELERELGESERTYRELWESLMSGVVFSDTEGRLRDANPGYLEMTGYSAEELSRLNFRDITPEKWSGLDEVALSQLRERGHCDLYEKEILRKDGTALPIDIRVWLLRDEEGNETGTWALVRDITDRKLVEQEMMKLNRELDGYARTVSHDLRGPLSAVSLAASLLADTRDITEIGELRDEVEDLAGVIERNVGHAHHMIDDLLALAKAGQEPKTAVDVEVSQAIEDILEEFAQDMRDRGVRLDIAPDLGTVRADATHVTQLFRNLISNAIRHNSSATPIVTIVRLESEAGFHRYLVKDNGPGIDPADMDSIFMPFFKSGRTGDTGIGLATVQKLVQQYRGSIRVYNDNGACFEFEIRDMSAGPGGS